MKRPFQVGDRVVLRFDNKEIRGPIIDIYPEQSLYRYLVSDEKTSGYDKYQVCAAMLRRLVPKKRREIWCTEYRDSQTGETKLHSCHSDTEQDALDISQHLPTAPIRFVEAKEKKK